MAIIRGSEGTLRIGSATYTTKKLLNFTYEGEVFKDPSASGFLKHVGNTDANFDIELFLLREDMAGLITAATPDSSGAIPTASISLTYGDIGGSSFTVSGNGFVSSVELIDSSAEEKVVAKVHVEFTGTPGVS